MHGHLNVKYIDLKTLEMQEILHTAMERVLLLEVLKLLNNNNNGSNTGLL
jgi:hypothetical protein